MKAAYHDYKNSAEQKDLKMRLIENERWYRLMQYQKSADKRIPRCRSGHLFNSILTKHADAMDNYPDVNILPREKNDTELAKTLVGVVSYVLECNDFEGVYSDNWYSKLKTCACYHVIWDAESNHYQGDIKISKTDLMNLFWQPSVCDIQDSEFVFYHSFMPKHEFVSKYGMVNLELCETVSSADTYYDKDFSFRTEMVLVLDCYYKKYRDDKSSILHFCKFSGDYIFFASEDEKDDYGKKLYDGGYYEHGEYPFYFDVMYPAEQCVAGFGVCDVLKPMQEYIDSLDSMIQVNNRLVGKPRYVINSNLGISAEEIADVSREIIKTDIPIEQNMLFKLPIDTLPSQVSQSRDSKIAELKEIIGNRDFQQGGTINGVTSGTALSLLQSVGDKLSRDIIKASYRCYKKIILCVIELIRQFYDAKRTIRIVGDDGSFDFIEFDNSPMKNRGFDNGANLTIAGDDIGVADYDNTTAQAYGEESEIPYFDVKLCVQKSNPFSRELGNQTILELCKAGLFNPESFEFNLPILKSLQFEGKDNLIKEYTELLEAKKNEQMRAAEQMQANHMMQSQMSSYTGGGHPENVEIRDMGDGGTGSYSLIDESDFSDDDEMIDITDMIRGG